MSHNDRDRNGGVLGELLGLVLTLVLWYWAFKFLSFIVIAMSQLIYELFKALLKLTIYLGKANKFGVAYLLKRKDLPRMRTPAESAAVEDVILTRPYSALDQTQLPAFVRKRLVASGEVSFGEKGLPQSDVASREEFRARNPFVKVDVPSMHFDRFLVECKWFEGRTGNFPSKEDQIAILNDLGM